MDIILSTYSCRVPKFGRDLAYDFASCNLFVSSSGSELYRLNLETGQFNEPYSLGFSGCNKIHLNPVHPLLGCGGENSTCEFWDHRSRKAVTRIQVSQNNDVEVSISIINILFKFSLIFFFFELFNIYIYIYIYR